MYTVVCRRGMSTQVLNTFTSYDEARAYLSDSLPKDFASFIMKYDGMPYYYFEEYSIGWAYTIVRSGDLGQPPPSLMEKRMEMAMTTMTTKAKKDPTN